MGARKDTWGTGSRTSFSSEDCFICAATKAKLLKVMLIYPLYSFLQQISSSLFCLLFSLPFIAIFHRIMQWFGWEETFEGHLIPTCLPWAGTVFMRPACSGLLQVAPTLEHFQFWGIHSFPGEPCQCLTTFIIKKNYSLCSI